MITIFFMELQVNDFLFAAQCIPQAPEICKRCDPWARDSPQRIFNPSLSPSSNEPHSRKEDYGDAKQSGLGLRGSEMHRKRFCELFWNRKRVGMKSALGSECDLNEVLAVFDSDQNVSVFRRQFE